MKEIQALLYIVTVNTEIGLYHPMSATVLDVTITVFWGKKGLEIHLTDGYDNFYTQNEKEAKKALRRAINNPRPRRDEYPVRMAS